MPENTGKQNVMSVTLRRLGDPLAKGTPIGLFYLVKNGPDDLRVHLRVSHDEAATFGQPVVVTDVGERGEQDATRASESGE